MAAYLVRTIDDHDTVGFFVADKMDDLLVAVDECTDPDGCEYIELRPGGLLLRSRSPSMQVMTRSKKSQKNFRGRERRCLSFDGVSFFGHTDEEWTEFFPGKPRKLKKAPNRPLGPDRVVPMKKQD